jgi:transposase
MGPRFKPVEREQPMLLPYDLKEWLPANHIVHFTIEAAEMVPMESFVVNERGSGDEQYHPHMLLALLLYCYSHGIFSSRRIEKATWSDVAVRYICANRHPDHDTICTFRVRNKVAISKAFLRILVLAKEMKILKLGTVSVDGTRIKANASIHKSIRYDRAGELEQELKLEIDELLARAEREDKVKDERGDEVDAELERLTELKAKMRAAQEEIEKRTRARAERDRKEYEEKVRDRNDRSGSSKGRVITEPKEEPVADEQANLTDADSRIMRKNNRSEYFQGYNAQAVVEAEGTMLVVAARVTNNASDADELAHDIAAIPAVLGKPTTVLADRGFASEKPVQEVQGMEITVLVSVTRETEHVSRRHDFRPKKDPSPLPQAKPYQMQWVKQMAEALSTDDAKKLYRLRKQSVEPVFGIIKQTLGFRQFLLRGLEKVDLEWQLVLCAYNLKRLAVLRS